MEWSAEQYLKFESERNRPIDDLLARVATRNVRSAIDLGCGPGNSTELIRKRFPGAQLSGIDFSSQMVAAARKRMPDTEFELADLTVWSPPARVDLIVANAVLQWVPDHREVLGTLLDGLLPGGHLAVQIPDNWNDPPHQLMRKVAASCQSREKLADAADVHAHRHTPAWYFQHIRPHVEHLEIWRTTYFHEIRDGPNGIVEWFKGSALRPMLALLDDSEKEDFLARYRDEIAGVYPEGSDGTVLLPFPRLFIVARLPGVS